MNNLVSYSASQLSLIRNTVARECNQAEFDLFIEMCKHQGLDPFRKQIYAFVFKSKKKEKGDDGIWREVESRQLTPVTSIDGYRSKAARCGDYRPDDHEPTFEYSASEKDGDKNPLGIVKCTVRAYKFGPDKQWYPVVGTVYWDEIAPIVEDGKWENGNFIGSGKFIIDKRKPNWRKMQRAMIAKCAEANALRKGWPEEMSGLYVQEEVDKALIDMTATEAAEAYQKEERMKRIAGNDAIPAMFEMTDGLQLIPIGKFADRVIEYIEAMDDAAKVDFWTEQNQIGLRQFWACQPNDGLELKKRIENIRSKKVKQQKEIAA